MAVFLSSLDGEKPAPNMAEANACPPSADRTPIRSSADETPISPDLGLTFEV
jgi:hypothetical protein